MYDICVFAGRMRPPTGAHLANIRAGLDAAQYVFVIIGSTGEATHFKNPFTFNEVETMIRGSLSHAENDRTFVFGVKDRDNDLAWVRDVQKVVHDQAERLSIGHDPRIALVGCQKDGSSYYLKLFRQWGSVGVQPILNGGESMSATSMRMSLYEAEDPRQHLQMMKDLHGTTYLPHGTFTFLRALPDHGNRREITPAEIGQTWLNYIIEGRTILWWGGMGNSTEHTAFLRLKQGIQAPQSGSMALNSQVVAEQIGAQIFIDGWGMVAPGDPQLAADLARRAASVSHDGEAIYGAQVIAAMEARGIFR